jgi:Sulfotransferase family
MIVSPSLRMIFVHIPKNAGSTVETLFAPLLNPRTDLHLSKASTLAPNYAAAGVDPHRALEKHSSADQIRRAMDREVFRRAFSFALSRNPFARAFSAYRFIQKKAEKEARDPGLSDDRFVQERQDFLTTGFESVCLDLHNVSPVHQLFLPQVSWLPTKGCLNYIGRVENMAQDMAMVFDLLRLPQAGLADIPTRNAKTAPDEWRGMSGASVDAIRAFYAADFERFGYGTDPMGDDTAPKRLPARGRGSRGDAALAKNAPPSPAENTLGAS